jgi:chlorobactene glucosyltransferase
MLPFWAVLAVVVAAAVVLVYQGVAIVFAYAIPRLAPAPPGPSPPDRVSVVIAARNEVDDLPGTLDDLLAQDYANLEIVVVDGGSTDGTGAAIEARGARVRRMPEPPLPPGWVGKNWACWTGANATDGEWLLFLDADVRTHPSAVRTVMEWATRENADLASISPTLEMRSFWERLVIPFFLQMVLTYFRAPRTNRATSRAALANGQFLMIRRAAYGAVGGHAAVRAYVLEDIALARRVRSAGLRLRLASATALAATRMYREPKEMFEGLLKNIHGTHFSAARQVGFLAGLIGLFLLPLGVLPLGWAEGDPLLIGLGAFLYVALFGKHMAFSRGVGAPAVYGLLYPVAVAYYVRLVGASLVRGLHRAPVAWKGRAYPMLRAGEGKP